MVSLNLIVETAALLGLLMFVGMWAEVILMTTLKIGTKNRDSHLLFS